MIATADTRLLLTESLTLDASHWETELVEAGAGAFVLAAAELALTGIDGRSLELLIQASTTDAGVLLDHGTGAGAQAYRLSMSVGGIIFHAGEALIAKLKIPDLGVESSSILISWSTEPNPQATDLADALRSELLIHNLDSGGFARRVELHPEAPAMPEGTLSVGGVWAGGELEQPWSGTLAALRAGASFHAAPILREHWIAQTPEFAAEGITRVERRHPPSTLADHGQLVGPLYQAATSSVHTNSHRLSTRLSQGLVKAPVELRADLALVYPPHWVTDVGDGWTRSLAWLFRRRIPRRCDHVLIRLQVALWAVEGMPANLEIRACVSNYAPDAEGENDENEPIVESVVAQRDTDDGVGGLGDQLDFPRLPVVRHTDGESWLWFEFRVAEGDPDAHTRFRLASWAFVPLSLGGGSLAADFIDI